MTKPPVWYKEHEIGQLLARNFFWAKSREEQISFIARHLQYAFEKGFSLVKEINNG